MKKLVFTALTIVLFVFSSNAQNKELENWHEMIKTYSQNINSILKAECPKDIDFDKFKEGVRKGEYKLSEESVAKISESTNPIKEYAVMFAKDRKIDISELSQDELLVMGTAFPPLTISDDILINTETQSKLTAGEVWNCLVSAVGLGGAGALGTFALNEAGITLLTRTLTKFLVKNLGWVGVAITVADFGFCIYDAS